MTDSAISPLAMQLKQVAQEICKLEAIIEETQGAAVKAMLSWELALLVSEHAALLAQVKASAWQAAATDAGASGSTLAA